MEEADRRKKEMTMIYLIVGLGIAAVLTVVLIKKV
jgi:predicted nucleic acid-binding Zn ribbon protein